MGKHHLGLRRSGGGGSNSGAGRISGLHGLRGADTTASRRRRAAYLPDSPEQHVRDAANTGRVHGLGSE